MSRVNLEERTREFTGLKRRLLEREKAQEQHKGQLQVIERSIKKEFGVSTLKQAEKKLASMGAELKALEKDINQKWEELQGYGI